MQYVSDRLFTKVSAVDRGDVAMGAGAAGLAGINAAVTSNKAQAYANVLRKGAVQQQEYLRDQLAKGQRPLNKHFAGAGGVVNGMFAGLDRANRRDLVRAQNLERFGRGVLNYGGNYAVDPNNTIREMKRGLRARRGVGAVAGLLGAGAAYGALKD